MIRTVVLPNARSGMTASYILAFGRAIGETLAVTMLIGNENDDTLTVFFQITGNTMASVIANQFGETKRITIECIDRIGFALVGDYHNY